MAAYSNDQDYEGGRPVLGDFVDDTLPQQRLQEPLSPRTELLSDSQLGLNDLPTGSLESRRRRQGRSGRRRRERDLIQSSTTQDELIRLLMDQDTETKKLRRALSTAFRRLDEESQRVEDLERANNDAVQRFRILNESRLIAQEEASNVSQELRLHQFQLETAQADILRAQETVKIVEKQRDDAEAAAERAKSKARKLHQRWLVDAAREEGRRYGFNAGFQRAQEEQKSRASIRASDIPNIQPIETQDPDRSYATGDDAAYQQTLTLEDDDEDLDVEGDNVSLDRTEPSPTTIVYRPPATPGHPSGPRPPPEPRTTFRPHSVDPPPEPRPTFRPHSVDPPQSARIPESGLAPNRTDFAQHISTIQPSPKIELYSLPIPQPENLPQAYNSLEEEAPVHQGKSQWVTAEQYGEIYDVSSSSAAPPNDSIPNINVVAPEQSQPEPRPGPSSTVRRIPPPGPPISHFMQQPQPQTSNEPRKGVKFRVLPRPSLAKTKEQASSWYRRLSFRRKIRPVIDPDESEEERQPQQPSQKSSKKKDESEDLYQVQPGHRTSWYANKTHKPPRSHDFAYSGRVNSTDELHSVSTRLSQLDLIAPPGNQNLPGEYGSGGSASGRSGKSTSRRLREQESVLSVIKEDPMSRGNTPIKDRSNGLRQRASSEAQSIGGKISSLPPPNFGVRSISSQSSSKLGDRRPPRQYQYPKNLSIPAPLSGPLSSTPTEMLYPLPLVSSTPTDALYPGPSRIPNSLGRKPTTASDNIGIEVEPPSQSPSSTQITPRPASAHHLSPNQVAQPYTTPQIKPIRPLYFNSPRSHTRSVSDVNPSHPMGNPQNLMSPPTPSPSNLRGSRRELQLANGIPPNYSEPKMQGSNSRRSSRANVPLEQDHQSHGQPHPESVRTNPSENLAHATSNVSLRSNPSYNKYDPSKYNDPALWPEVAMYQGGLQNGSQRSLSRSRVHSRAASASSALSYVN